MVSAVVEQNARTQIGALGQLQVAVTAEVVQTPRIATHPQWLLWPALPPTPPGQAVESKYVREVPAVE